MVRMKLDRDDWYLWYPMNSKANNPRCEIELTVSEFKIIEEAFKQMQEAQNIIHKKVANMEDTAG